MRSAVAMLTVLKLVVNTAFRFVYPFLPAIARGLGISLTQAGLLVSVRWTSSLMTPVLMALSGPGRRSRRLLVIGLVVFATGALVTAWTGFYVGALIGFAMFGLAKPMIDISAQVYVSERVGYGKRARYLGTLEIAWAGGLLLGAPVAGWLIDTWRWESPFWVFGSLALVGVGGALIFLDADDRGSTSGGPHAGDSSGRQIAILLATISLFGFAHESLLVVLGSWLEDSFGLALLALGGVGTMIGVSELLGEGAMVAFTDRIGKRNSVAIGLGLACVTLLVLGLVSGSFLPAMIALVVVTLGIEFGYISAIPLATELRPRARGRVLAWFIVANGLGRMSADVISPRVFQAGGLPRVTVMASAAALLALLVLLSGLREVDGHGPQGQLRAAPLS